MTKEEKAARRRAMKSFGLWLDYARWKMRAQNGIEDFPEGDDISDMARSVVTCEENYKAAANEYIHGKEQVCQRISI